MTTQHPSATATTRSPITSSHYTPEQAPFFGVLGHNNGAREIVAGTPDTYGHIQLLVWTTKTFRQAGHVHTREWIEDDQERKAARHIADTAAEWGNVYCSVGTYAKVANTFKPGTMRYCRDVPFPRHCFALDDVRDLAALRLRPTMAIETSPGNYQVIYRCDDLLIPRHAVQLATGAATLAGCDASGADAEQLIRIPGTHNTKPTCGPEGWTVRLVYADGPSYSREQLARAFLPGGLGELRVGGGTTDTPLPHLHNDALNNTATSELWHSANALDQADNIRRGGPWLTSSGALRRLKPDHFINNVLTGASLWTGAPGGAATYSEFRHHLIKALWLHGFPEPEIRVLSQHLASDDSDKRGGDGLRTDIDRIIGKLASTHPRNHTRINPTPHLTTDEASQRPLVTRAKRRVRNDRPGLKGGADELLHRYRTDSTLCALPQTARATALGVALATLKRMEAHLLAHRHITIERVTTPTGWATRVLLVPADDEPSPLSSPNAVEPITTPQSAAEISMESTPAFGPLPQSDGEAASDAALVAAAPPEAPALADAAGGTSGVCSPEVAPTEPREPGAVLVLLLTLLRTAIRASFDRWQATQQLDQRTGELKRCNVTRRRIEADVWAEGLGLAAPELVQALIVEERQRREALALKALSLNGLRAELRKTEAHLERARKRHEPTGWLHVRVDLLQAEMRMRPPEPDEIKRRRRRGGPVRPDQRAAAKQYELELLDQVDKALGRVPLRGSCEQGYAACGVDVVDAVTA